jgi:predicted transcriptional regulator
MMDEKTNEIICRWMKEANEVMKLEDNKNILALLSKEDKFLGFNVISRELNWKTDSLDTLQTHLHNLCDAGLIIREYNSYTLSWIFKKFQFMICNLTNKMD